MVYNREIGCWPWDVCAGIVIAQEAGGVVSGSHAFFASNTPFEANEELLWGRKYALIRGIGDTEVCSLWMRRAENTI